MHVMLVRMSVVQGISGGLWFAAGAVIQIFFFGIIAVEIKRRAPTCHTVLEIVASRWGNVPRIVSRTGRDRHCFRWQWRLSDGALCDYISQSCAQCPS